MQIPTGNFGQAVAQPAQAAQPIPIDTTSAVQQGLQATGGDYLQYQDRQNALKATLALATAQNALHDAHDEVTRGVLDGSIAPDDAHQQLADRARVIQQVNSQGLTRDNAAALNTEMVRVGGALSTSLNDTLFKYGQSQNAATLDATAAQLQQDAQRRGPAAVSDTYDALLDFGGADAGMNPAQIQARKLAFRQSTTADFYVGKASTFLAQGTDALQSGDKAQVTSNLGSLSDTLHEVMGPAGDQMSPEQKSHVVTHLVGLQNQLLAGQARQDKADQTAAIAKENDGVDAYNQARTVVFNGQYLSPDAIADLTSRTNDTKMAMPARQLLTMQEAGVSFASAPADQRAAMLEHFRAEAANPAVGTSADGRQQLQLIEALDAKEKAAQADNPWQAAQTYGVIKNAPAFPMNAESLPQTLDLRMQNIAHVEAWVGHKISPLQPIEAQQLASIAKSMPVDQAASLLSTLGGLVQDPDRIGAIAKQFGDKDGSMGLAMAMAGDRSEDGKLVSEYILRGAQALQDKTAQVAEGGMLQGTRAAIAQEIRGAYSDTEMENQAIEAAYLVAAGRSAMGQSDDTDAAVKMVTGGITTHGSSDGKIPLPQGMDAGSFEKRINAMQPGDIAPQAPDGRVYAGQTPVSLDSFVKSLPDATLVHAGQGLYSVRAGNRLVTNSNGQRMVLRVGP